MVKDLQTATSDPNHPESEKQISELYDVIEKSAGTIPFESSGIYGIKKQIEAYSTINEAPNILTGLIGKLDSPDIFGERELDSFKKTLGNIIDQAHIGGINKGNNPNLYDQIKKTESLLEGRYQSLNGGKS